MPSWPCSVRISANRKATSVIAFCRPVSTLASLIGFFNGSVIEDSLTDSIRSNVASPAARAFSAASGAASALLGRSGKF